MVVENEQYMKIRPMPAEQIDACLAQGLGPCISHGKKVLLIIPDPTRTAPVADMVRRIHRLFKDHDVQMDILVALGTHPPLTKEEMGRHLGAAPASLETLYPGMRIMNHAWNDPGALLQVGNISAERVAELTRGLMAENVPLTLNRVICDYDQLLILGPVFPHEVAGFSGGSKYLFPGISGPEMIDFFHWLGAVITNLKIIGVRDNPVRAVLEEAAAQVPVPVQALSLVVHQGQLTGFFVGPVGESWRAAVEQSARLHIIRTPRRYRRVLSCAPRMYADLWTGGKCMYKCEPVVADGGELIIYAPHITSFSVTHGPILEWIGYHVRDYYLKQIDHFAGVPRAVMAVSTYLKGAGTFEDNVERARISVALATGISRETCEHASLGYVDPASIRFQDWQNREDEGILFVAKAGETLYLPHNAEQ